MATKNNNLHDLEMPKALRQRLDFLNGEEKRIREELVELNGDTKDEDGNLSADDLLRQTEFRRQLDDIEKKINGVFELDRSRVNLINAVASNKASIEVESKKLELEIKQLDADKTWYERNSEWIEPIAVFAGCIGAGLGMIVTLARLGLDGQGDAPQTVNVDGRTYELSGSKEDAA